jgi:hypothetical protein
MMFALLAAFPLAGLATVGIGARFGTTGFGGEVGVELVEDYLNLRVAGNAGALDVNVDQDDVTYETELRLQTWLAVLDWHVGGGPFKIVVGGCYNATEATGTATPVNDIDVGDISYTPAQIGQLYASAEYGTVGGYLGFGFGNIASSKNGRWSASMDFGVMFFQEPDLTLESRGGTLSNTPGVQESLQKELDDFDEDYITWLRYYPVLTFGVAVRF